MANRVAGWLGPRGGACRLAWEWHILSAVFDPLTRPQATERHLNRNRSSSLARASASGLTFSFLFAGLVALVPAFSVPSPANAQDRGTPFGEWRFWGADAWSTRYSLLDQIDADNFGDLEQAWLWRGDNFGPSLDYILRSTPI